MVAPAGAKYPKKAAPSKTKDKKRVFNKGKGKREKFGAARKRICRVCGKQRRHQLPFNL